MDKLIYEKWSGNTHFNYRTQLAFPEHLHDEVEIVIAKQITNGGYLPITVEGKEYRLGAGEIFCAFPNQAHSYGNGTGSFYITIFDSDCLRMYGNGYTELVPECPIISDGELYNRILPYFAEAYRIADKNEKFKREKLRAIALLILGYMLEGVPLRARANIKTNALNDIFAYCNENYASGITLESLSQSVKISKSHIVKLFRQRLNTTFKQYIRRMRISEAKKLLQTTNKSITEISIAVGYDTIRSFNYAFLNETGSSPTDFRKNG